MSESVELNGEDRRMIYRLRYCGGPDDGMVVNSFRPYDKIRDSKGHVYRAKIEGKACLIWIDDWTRDIELYYAGQESSIADLT